MMRLLTWALAGCALLSMRLALAEPVIVELRAAAPTVLVAVMLGNAQLENGDASKPDELDLDPARWKINGGAPLAIHRYSMPIDENRVNQAAGAFPVTVQHRIYLTLAQPLQEGVTYAVASPYGTSSLAFGTGTTFCESIKVNQVGYSARSSSRHANFGVFMGDGGSITFLAGLPYRVVRDATGAVVAQGLARYMGDDTFSDADAAKVQHPIKSGEHVYRLSLNDVPAGGLYHVEVPGCGRSRSFGIGDRYLREAAYVATRNLYHQRCGTALLPQFTDFTHEVCHPDIAWTRINPGNEDGGIPIFGNYPTHKISGGYHDAGNFQRLYGHTIIPLMLLGYYEAFPSHFVDNQYRLPESGNGVPDILDEALWGIKVWEHLQIRDPSDPEYGGVMAGTIEQPQPGGFYGWGSSANNPPLEGTWPVTPEATGTSAGLFAHAARLLRKHDTARADELLARARLAWAHLKRIPGAMDAPRAHVMYGALQLYLATGEAEFHDAFKSAAWAIVVNHTAPWPETFAEGNFSATVNTAAQFISYLLPASAAPLRDASLAAALKNEIIKVAETGTYMGPGPENEPYAQGVSKFLGWGTGVTQGRYADAFVFAWLLTDDPSRKQHYLNAVSQYADYALGLNPLGMSFYTGLGWDQPNSPLHLDSYFTKYGQADGKSSEHLGRPIGNYPGILVMGPSQGLGSSVTYQAAVFKKIYPEFNNKLPPQRRYAHGWSMANGNEGGPALTVWNIAMLGFLLDNPSAEGAACTSPKPLMQSQSESCPAGQVGAITSTRDHVCVNGQWTPSLWQPLDNTCSVPCPGAQPADEMRYAACGDGQVGSNLQKRSYACRTGAWTPSDWITASSTCMAAPPPQPECTVDPVSNSVTVRGLSTLTCVQRGDTGAVRSPLEQVAVFPGAPSADFDVFASDRVGPDGKCANTSYSARCVAPKGTPQCAVSPWDGALRLSGLGSEVACVKRNDTQQSGQPAGGKLSFPGPAAAGVTVSLFGSANADGSCGGSGSQLACAAVPAPSPVCTIKSGGVQVDGLNAATPCVARSDTGETRNAVGGQVLFAGAPAGALSIGLFSDMSANGSCSGQVGKVDCVPEPPPACAGPQPADDFRNLACAPGLIGYIRQERSFACVGSNWIASDWRFARNNCAPPPQGEPECTVDPVGNTLILNNLQWLRCLKRSDNNAVTLINGQTSTTLAGAPATDFDMLGYGDVDGNGDCTRFLRLMRCAVPVPASPQCFVSPWDNSVQVSGLGTEMQCATRVDNGRNALAFKGRLSFSGPAPDKVSVLTFGAVNADGACIGQKGLLECTRAPLPAPVCSLRPDGTPLVTGLNQSTPCVARSDTGDMSFPVNGQAGFSAPGSGDTRVVYFSGIGAYGQCVGPVGAVRCSAPAPEPEPVCTGAKPADDWRNLACAPGQVGYLKQTRTYACKAGEWAPTDWTFDSNRCTPPPQGDPQCSIDPAAGTITMTNISWQRCLQRSDNNAITHTNGEATITLPGAPAADFDMMTYDGVDANGGCTRFARVARCTVPVAAQPRCFVSPWDGSLQVSGLGNELLCARRDDNGKLALSDRGRLSFSGPATVGGTVSLFRSVAQDGQCTGAAGQATCPAVPKPAPACTVQADGSMLVSGLNEATPCVSRNDTGEQRIMLNGRAVFQGAAPGPDTRVLIFSGINTYNACVGPVAAVACQPAQ